MDTLRKVLAVLFALRAATNFGKPFRAGSGFVVFGQLMQGFAATVVAPLVGVAIVVYAFGLWQARPWAKPLGILFAIWSTLNVVLFPAIEGLRPGITPAMYAVFAVGGIVGPWLAVWLLGRSLRA